MVFTDTHTHLYSESFAEDRDEVVQEAINKGVERFFLPAIDSTYLSDMRELKNAFPLNMFLMSGLHPTHVKENYQEELAVLESFLDEAQAVAVGEIGMDLYWGGGVGVSSYLRIMGLWGPILFMLFY